MLIVCSSSIILFHKIPCFHCHATQLLSPQSCHFPPSFFSSSQCRDRQRLLVHMTHRYGKGRIMAAAQAQALRLSFGGWQKLSPAQHHKTSSLLPSSSSSPTISFLPSSSPSPPPFLSPFLLTHISPQSSSSLLSPSPYTYHH